MKCNYQIVRSRKGTPVIYFNGFRYGPVRNPKYPNKYWVCTSNQSSQCRARAVMKKNGNLWLKEYNYHYFIIPTRMGNPKLICSGYEYLGNRRNIEKQREYCICKNYSKSSCKARAVIYKEGGVSFSGTHNHPPPATTRNLFHRHINFKKELF
ncbi:hypothetical protein Phum_PHUM149620 [Pediculus humanus corporis]|uniref:FLYWCH-type domain-containing protein n=1 Tax=Pediculus humanus subsp. corporis TaxID=121224 RepID=E0VF61_PEDHC|nr:uncharacterized protein Phum_PHUM149620 [Pediculus humanus corporis]EEB12017.1 hypothetical protein Phum_PHUM149620 [Pediculus humanus corporis]